MEGEPKKLRRTVEPGAQSTADSHAVPVIEQESATEHWDWSLLKKRINEAAQANSVGLCEYDELPGSIEVGDIGERLRGIAEHSARSVTEEGFSIYLNHATGKVMVPKKNDVGRFVEGLGVQVKLRQRVMLSLHDQRLLRSKFSSEEIDRVLAAMNNDAFQSLFSDDPVATFIRTRGMHPIGSAHSHPMQETFSTRDLTSMLRGPHLPIHVVVMPDKTLSCMLFSNQTEWVALLHFAGSSFEDALARTWFEQRNKRISRLFADPANTLSLNELIRRAAEAMVKSKAKHHKFGYYQTAGPEDKKLLRVV